MNMVIENVRQLRGTVDDYCPNAANGEHTYDYSEGGCRQVKDAESQLWPGANLFVGVGVKPTEECFPFAPVSRWLGGLQDQSEL